MHDEHGDDAPHENDGRTQPEVPEHQQTHPSAADPEPPEPADEALRAPEPADAAENEANTDGLADLVDVVSELKAEVREHHSRAAARERVIDNLHAEVERLRAGEQNLLLRPIVTDLQNLRKDLLNQARTLATEVDREQVAGLLESYALSVELALERCGSVPIRPDTGDRFAAREHRAVKVLPADGPEQDGTVAAVMADGYRDTETDRVTTPARVHVYRWESGGSAEQEQENADA